MTDKHEIKAIEDDTEDENDLNYRAPEKKSLQEIQEMDKKSLAWSVPATVDINVHNVQVMQMKLVCSEAPEPLNMDLIGNVASLKDKIFIMKEDMSYRIKITFKENKEIVSGLKYLQNTFRNGIRVDKETHMVGRFLMLMEEVPQRHAGLGTYNMKS